MSVVENPGTSEVLSLDPGRPPRSAPESDSVGHLPAVVGGVEMVTMRDGCRSRIVQLNNAATTPPLAQTLAAVTEFLGRYGALHRGAGPRARLTCEAVEEAVGTIRRFLGVRDDQALVFTENTSAAINLLARLLQLGPDDAVLTSEIEHTSNYLPWRLHAGELVEIAADVDGSLNYDDLARKAADLSGRVRVIAVTGASNQTGYISDIRRLASIAQSCGALLFVDAAQLAPHRPINMASDAIDALAFSAHKVYAPFGLGVLALPRRLLDVAPVNPGGGSIDMISADRVIWAPPTERHQTGTWNAPGIVALGASCKALMTAGWDAIQLHEQELCRHAARRLSVTPDLRVHVPLTSYLNGARIGAFPLTLGAYHHAALAAILEHEYAIEVRAGTICNHRLVSRWFDVSTADQAAIEARIQEGDRLASYGIVRASLGLHNTIADIDALADALTEISIAGPKFQYRPVPSDELYEPI
jgi:cysteine desulfurase / selenocysteine lyase